MNSAFLWGVACVDNHYTRHDRGCHQGSRPFRGSQMENETGYESQ